MRDSAPTVAKAKECLKLGLVEAAVDMLGLVCKKEPRNAEAAHLHGLALFQTGMGDRGIAELERAIKLHPSAAALHIALANAQMTRQRHEGAAAGFQKAIKLDSKAGPAHLGLALALTRLHDLSGAIAAAREAIRLMPNSFQPYANLSTALREAGEVDEAISVLEGARQRFPKSAEILGLLLTARNYSSKSDPERCVQEARQFGALVEPPDQVDWPNLKEPDRRLRVGYLSADLRTHSVAYFFEPILANHDRSDFEPFVYSLSPRTDATTERLRSHAAQWIDASRLDTNSLLAKLREDRLDILIELGGHTNNNRLAALARAAAPIQVTYLGYPNTTGVPAIGYRIVDALTDPTGAESYATEHLLRLPRCFICYSPPSDAPQPSPPPCERSGFVTFGCFNSLPKIDPQVIDAWARLLEAFDNSHLFLKNRSFADSTVREHWMQLFAERGIDPDRVELTGRTATPAEHLAMYARVDVALDTFPYNGTTTTCEALWMGVPVVTLEGRTHAGRVGVSLLHAVGLGELVAPTVERHVAIARNLAADSTRLSELRRTLRARLADSPLCDSRSFVRNLEAAYRRIWQSWCNNPGSFTSPAMPR